MARIIDTPELDPVLFPNISVAGFLFFFDAVFLSVKVRASVILRPGVHAKACAMP